VNKHLKKRVEEMVAAEQMSQLDEGLLLFLNAAVERESVYFQLETGARNALNEFFRQARDYMLSMLCEGNYGATVIIDSFLVTMFEVGYRTGDDRALATKKEGGD